MNTHIAHAIRNSSSCADPATCWGPARSAQCIRFEQADGTVHLFPFVQFVCAEFRCENAAELLRIEFGSHCLELEGVHLGEIVVALQVLEVGWVRTLPRKFQPAIHAGCAAVFSMRVKRADAGLSSA